MAEATPVTTDRDKRSRPAQKPIRSEKAMKQAPQRRQNEPNAEEE